MSSSTVSIRIILLVASVVLAGSKTSAETYGTFFYRTGDPQSYLQFETTIHLNGGELVVEDCSEHMRLLVSQGARQCGSQTYDKHEFSITDEIIEYVGGDVERVDRKSRQFTIEDHLDHHVIVRNVKERFDGWATTPASWQLRTTK